MRLRRPEKIGDVIVNPSMKLSTRRSLSSKRNSRRVLAQEANHSTKYLIEKNGSIKFQKSGSGLLKMLDPRSVDGEFEINSDFYSKYEILMIYGPIVSSLKLPKVNFAFRPKVWQK